MTCVCATARTCPSRAPALSALPRLPRAPMNAGVSPVRIPATNAAATENANVRQSATALAGSASGWKLARMAAPPHCAMAMPATPPNSARTTLSVRHCAASRPRLTPRASRTATSRRRRSARARKRLATFAQAMTRTIAATPLTHSAVRASRLGSGPLPSLMADAMARGRALSIDAMDGSNARCAAQLRRYALVRSADAASRLTPGRVRTIISIQPQL